LPERKLFDKPPAIINLTLNKIMDRTKQNPKCDTAKKFGKNITKQWVNNP